MCNASDGAIDQKQAESAGLGLIIGAAALVGVPFYLMASETSQRQGSRLFGFFEKRDKRREEAHKRSMETMRQGRNRMSDAPQPEKDESFRRMLAAM